MIFTANQSRHFFVADSTETTPEFVGSKMFFNIGNERTDLIDLNKVMYVKQIHAQSYGVPTNIYCIRNTDSSSNVPIVVNVEVSNIAGFGDDQTHVYFGATKGTRNWAHNIVASFQKNLRRSIAAGVNPGFVVTTEAPEGFSPNEINSRSDNQYLLYIYAVADTSGDRPDRYTVNPPMVRVWISADEFRETDNKRITEVSIFDDRDQYYTTFEIADFTTLFPAVNGPMVSAMEYFYEKERGDLYGGAMWPNDFIFKGKANKESSYYLLEIHYYDDNSNESVQKSEKDLTLACTSDFTAALDLLVEKGIKVKVVNADTSVSDYVTTPSEGGTAELKE